MLSEKILAAHRMFMGSKRLLPFHKICVALLLVDFISGVLGGYIFTMPALSLICAAYVYSLFALSWDTPDKGRFTFYLKVILEVIIFLSISMFALGSMLGYSHNIAKGCGYRLRMEGAMGQGGPAGVPFYVLYRYLYIIEKPYAEFVGYGEMGIDHGDITTIQGKGQDLQLYIAKDNKTIISPFRKN